MMPLTRCTSSPLTFTLTFLLMVTLQLTVSPVSTCADVYVYQNKALYQLELNGPPVNITCTHRCKQDENTHPILTIQMPGDDYKHYKLHSTTLRSRFLTHHNITGLVDMELYDETPCYTNGSRSYHLELSSINTTLLNNSVIHCGVTWSNADETCMHNFFADGISYLVMPANDTESDTDLMCMTSPPPSTSPSSTSAEIVPSRATTFDLTTTTTTCVLTTTEMIYITPSSLPTETSITNTLGVGSSVFGPEVLGVLASVCVVAALLGAVIASSVCHFKARSAQRRGMNKENMSSANATYVDARDSPPESS